MSTSLSSSSSGGSSSKGLTLLELKMRAKAKEDDERAKAARKRNMIVLILDYFSRAGYTESMDRLSVESGISMQKWRAADNVDLMSILQEFETFYEMKYQRQPRLVRPTNSEDEEMNGGGNGNSKGGKDKKKSVPLPPLPSGVGSTPSALPQAYRGSYANVDGYAQQNGGGGDGGYEQPDRDRRGATLSAPMTANNNTNSSPSSTNPTASKDRRSGVHSAKGSKADKLAAAVALDGASTAQQQLLQQQSSPRSSSTQKSTTTTQKRDKRKEPSEKKESSPSFDISIQGASSAMNSSSSPSAAPHHSKSSSALITSSSSSSSKNARASPPITTTTNSSPQPQRSESPSEYDDGSTTNAPSNSHSSYYETRLLKPMPEYADSQFRELAHIITRDIYSENPNVRWRDVAELEEAKQLLKEAVVMPLKFPQFFTGLLSPWKGVLLYGPPGTGKTMLARAVATECRTTFFNISASSIVSKYRGDSEKLVRVLFELARYHAPSTVFIDEIDSIMGRRDAAGEHEGSRRMKTELLIQMDGLSRSSDLVFVLAASNLPWDLDIALLRRLEKRILVPLPNERARQTMIRQHLTDGERAQGLDYTELAKKTEGYSGSDLAALCKEAAMRPVRRLMKQLLTVESDDSKAQQEVDSEVRLDPVIDTDMKAALSCTRPSAQSKFLQKYTEWHALYGAGMNEIEGNTVEKEDEK